MKIRGGFVSNSSSTSFMITNTTKKPLNLVEFVKENIELVDRFNEEYDHNFTHEQAIESAEEIDKTLKPGENYCTFGDEDGTILGNIYDYILRGGGKSERFSWRFEEFNR